MHKAYQQVFRNQGSAGIDGMRVSDLLPYVREHREEVVIALTEGRYKVQPILGVSIPKSNGKKRLLGIPTVIDRWLQQCVLQAIAIHFEPEFMPHSYGFRPNKNALQCVLQSKEYIHDGYQHIVDIDLKNFFDEVNHCQLLELLFAKIKCPITLRLIRKWLRAPILIDGKLTKRRKGVPQGSPLSPLLSNIMLHELDKELTRQGLKYVRYADDFSIYCKTNGEARKTEHKIDHFISDQLKLEVNLEKSGIRKPVDFSILGYEYVPTYEKGKRGKYQLVVSDKGWKRVKEQLKVITRKTSPISLAERIRQIKEVQNGWLNYFRMASIHGKLKLLDGWLRNRLRYCIWHDWKKPERKRKNLIRLGVSKGNAYA